MLTGKKLKYIVVAVLFFVFSNQLHAQNFGVFISPGLINYGGDLQQKVYTFSQSGFSISGGALYNINHFTIRAAFTYGKIQGSDTTGGYPNRNLSFQSKLTEGSLSLQYDIFDLAEKKFTPYVLAGAAVYSYDPYTYYNGQKIYLQPLSTEGQGLSAYPGRKVYSLTQFAVPWGIGFKYKLTEQFLVGVEFCSRILFTDYLDDVSTNYPDETTLQKEKGQLAVDVSYRGDERNPANTYPSGAKRGNPGQNDNYYTSSISIIYMFPRHEQFANSEGHHKRSKALDCPRL